jgi:hypothetical protein
MLVEYNSGVRAKKFPRQETQAEEHFAPAPAAGLFLAGRI